MSANIYYLLFSPTTAHTRNVQNYVTNAPTYFGSLHHLQGALILCLLKL